MTGGVLCHVQYLLGVGHLQRSLRIAEALADQGIAVTLVCGGEPIPALAARRPGLRLVQLPPVRALDARFEMVDSAGRPLDDTLRAARREMLLATFAEARPDAVVLEGFPFARRAFRFELDPLIAAVRAARPRPLLLSSVRDILVRRDDPERHRETLARVLADFDAVLVHGDPAFIPFAASFPAVSEIADRLIYTGYVANRHLALPHRSGEDRREVAEAPAAGEVIVSGGGGPAGFGLLRTAIEARRLGCLADARWRLLAGAAIPKVRFAELAAEAPDGVAVERFRADFPVLLRDCRVSVSQAGYNTVLDLLAARVPAVLVPFAAERETEQLVRAERLAALGAAELLRESELSPARLAAAIQRADARNPTSVEIDTGGAERSARLIAEMIGKIVDSSMIRQ